VSQGLSGLACRFKRGAPACQVPHSIAHKHHSHLSRKQSLDPDVVTKILDRELPRDIKVGGGDETATAE